jgi:PTH1 family peptidyl-tRNA hydrolase
MESPDRIIVGLGNPGEQYAGNRHNIGFMVVDALARDTGAGKWSTEFLGRICTTVIDGHPVLLAEPWTYMNNSGKTVQLLLSALNRGPQDLLLILDDFSLPFGRIRIRERGSDGGHRGLESVMTVLNTDEIPRMRMGIGEEQMPEDKADFVLSDFPPGRQPELNDMIRKAEDAVKAILNDGVSKAMAVFNT